MARASTSSPSFRISVETRLAVLTSGVLVLLSMTLFLRFAVQDRARFITSKTTAASMVTQLLANELTAAVDFEDLDDMTMSLNFLHANPDIVAAAVWPTQASQGMLVGWADPGVPENTRPRPDEADGATTSADWLVATRTIIGQHNAPLARVRIVFSLRSENEAFRSNRRRLFFMTAGLSVVAALLLAMLARRYVAGPIERLASAASALADGELPPRVVVGTNDEIGDLARAFNSMSEAVASREERLHNELKLAQRIQTSILPRVLAVSGLELCATMVPAKQVGGDYYDVLPVENGCWIGIGDVAGHGLDAGLIMLMTQSVVASLVARDPLAAPSEVVCVLNEVLFDNIRNRLRRTDHVTLTLLRYHVSGAVTFAGAHEDIVIYRKEEGKCELVSTPGTWVGGRRDITGGTVDSLLTLRHGDVMVLYSDGLIEIRNAQGEQFGVERLCAELEPIHDQAVTAIQEHLFLAAGAWGIPDDDVTMLVVRYVGDPGDATSTQDASGRRLSRDTST